MVDDQSSSTKRRKVVASDSSSLSSCSLLSSSTSTLHNHGIHSLAECSKGRMPHERSSGSSNFPIKEYVLHVPPRLTKSAYQILLISNAVPRTWHLEGRFGSRTHKIDEITNGIPVLPLINHDNYMSTTFSKELIDLLQTEGVSIVTKKYVRNHRTDHSDIPDLDARIHPELEPCDYCLPSIIPKCANANDSIPSAAAFTYAELFGGIGGFGVALERLGGKCIFYSEIDERCRETYALNFTTTPTNCIHGDIYDIPDDEFPTDLDVLVAGFPCQPFTTLGEQPGFNCDKGILFMQIVRMLELSKPKGFLLENVPGLLGMRESLIVIVNAFRGAGYKVTAELCSARGLTATSRKRLFFVGVRENLVASTTAQDNDMRDTTQSTTPFDCFFQFPFIPDLKICCHDILDYDSLPTSELEVLRLSQSTFSMLSQNKCWKPSHLAWPNRHCDTLTSHYGNAVGRGESQLVPSSAPHPPRRFSVRECARTMGIPNSFKFCDILQGQGEMAKCKEGYRMIGNSVCPPLIAALAGAVLDAIGVDMVKDKISPADDNWTAKGIRVAIDLACCALRASPVPLPAGCLVSPENEKKG